MNGTSFRTTALVFISLATGLAAPDAVDPAHLAYNLKTTVDVYDVVGKKSPKWDTAARKALTDFSRVRAWTNDSPHAVLKELREDLGKVTSLGCDDLLIRYLQLRFVDTPAGKDTGPGFQDCAAAFEKSNYPEIRKFYASFWAGKSEMNKGQQGASASLVNAARHLAKAMEDPAMPLREAEQGTELLMNVAWWPDPLRWECYQAIEKPLTNRWAGTSLALLTRGRAYLSYAWKARGTSPSGNIPESTMKLARERLKIAAEAFESAWHLDPEDPQICLEMVRVEMGRDDGRQRMESWFQRGMKLDPHFYDLAYAKLEYLRPRWHGSLDEMINFGRQCTTNTDFHGTVRLMLADAHFEVSREITDPEKQKAYWKQPRVWADIQPTYEQFFKLYPGADAYRQNYARYAAFAGQWQEFLNQARLFPSTNYALFGGLDQFNKLLKEAEQNTRKR